MRSFSRGWFALLAILLTTYAFTSGGCSQSAKTPPVDAAHSVDLGTEVDAPSGTGGRGSGGALGIDGGGGTLSTGGTGGSSVTVKGSGGGIGSGGTNSSIDGGVGGVSTGGRSGTGGVGTGGTKTGSGGTVSVGGSATSGTRGTGGIGSGGTVGVGGSATGGTPGTGGIGSGGTVGVGGSATGGIVGTGGTTVVQACPDSSSYIGNATWPDKLVVTAGAKYCGHFKEMRNLDQEYAAKAKLSIAAGTYPLANTAGTYDFALPVCFEVRPGVPVPAFAGAGKVTTTPYKGTVNTFASCTEDVRQPLTSVGSISRFFSMGLVYFSWTGPPQPPVLDGSVLDQLSSGQVGDTRPGYSNALELCEGTACDDDWQDVLFHACNPDYPLQRHTVTFEGGQIVLDVRITGAVNVSVMLAAFTSASGTLNGTTFTQTDYWKLVYSADHHHFTRNFAVLFDTPIGGACGLKVTNFWGSRYQAPLPEVYTIKCDLSNIAAAAVTSATVDLP